MKNKTKEDIKQIIMSYALPGNLLEDVKGTELAKLVDTLSENFVARVEVRNEIKRWLEDDYYSEGEAWVKAKLVEQLLESLE